MPMLTTELYDLIHATPFQPFVVRMADGNGYSVPDPDFIAYKRGGLIALVVKDEGTGALIDLRHAIALEYQAVEKASADV